MSDGLTVQNESWVQITKSNFVDNAVYYALIKVFSSSTLLILDCIMQKNQS